MRVILLSLMMVCLFGYHANAGNLTSLAGRQSSCHGLAEIRSKFNGTETVHGKMIKKEGEGAKKASRLVYKVPGGRRGYITIEVQGNCCWKFYQRYGRHFQSCIHLVLLLFLFFSYRLAGNFKSVKGSGIESSSFAPRSLKVFEC